MTKNAGLGLIVGAVVFLSGALIPLVRGDDVNATLLALAVVFFVVGFAKRRAATRPAPPPNNG